MPQRITVVDAFTDRPFAGNPAGVCILARPAGESWMKNVAREMNLSETAFLHPMPEVGVFSLRWLTPVAEVDLCGHATLASAHVLWDEGHLAPDAIPRFTTRSGMLSAVRRGREIELDFPALPTTETPAPPGLVEALGAEILHCGATGMDLLVELTDEAAVRGLTPDFAHLARLPVRGLIATSRSAHGEFDFVSRFFAPAFGIAEDPVTGSAHCALAGYWGERLGKTEMIGYQASQRGGIVRVRRDGNRVKLGGQAVTTLRGELTSDPR
jgi:predicted PhzF superfamily epimerase YddE/YHI9